MDGKSILLTGGTGSFGKAFTKMVLKEYSPKVIRIFSRDELKQSEMQREFNDNRLRFLLGDIRERDRLYRAMNGIDIVVHAAALKRIEFGEYNPFEFVSTNILGAKNIIDAAIDSGVEKAIGISSDKACAPINLYGITKACMEKLFTQANVYARKQTKFSCVRYGNVLASRGSVIGIFIEQKKRGTLTITHPEMTRFFITLNEGTHFVANMLSLMRGGEVFIPRIPSTKIIDLAEVIAPDCRKEFVGIRPGEKLHEVLITEDEARHTREFEDYFVICPEFPFWTEDTYWDLTGQPLPEGYRYSSDRNSWWITKEKLKEIINEYQEGKK